MRRSDAAQNERKIAIKTLAESVPAVIRDTYSRRYLIADASGKSHISMEDYAIATVDELEVPVHRRERFTIGY